jgi:antitoxin (DNA-binding transcriptional repressor) of toxin-antitoxin stability system
MWLLWPHMKSVNVAGLKNRLSAYLSEVRAGQEILGRDRQAPIARILPVAHGVGEDEHLQLLAAQGNVRLGGAPLDETFWALPAPRVRAAAMKRALDQERDDRGR